MNYQNGFMKPLDEHIVADSLKVIAHFTHSQRAHLAFLNQDWRKMRTVFSWPDFENGDCRTSSEGALRIQVEGGISPDIVAGGRSRSLPDLWMQSGWWLQRLRENRNYYCFTDLDGLPEEVRGDVNR